jgi:hypothetical protein
MEWVLRGQGRRIRLKIYCELLQLIVIMSNCKRVINKSNHQIQISSNKSPIQVTIFKNLINISQEICSVSITEASGLMLFWAIIAVCCKNDMKRVNIRRGYLTTLSVLRLYTSNFDRRIVNEYETAIGMRICRGNRSTRIKPAQALFCSS